MCFRFSSCFGSGSGQDYGRSTPKTTHRGGRSNWGSLADHGYYSGVDHKAPPAYHNQSAASDESGTNAYNNSGIPKDHANDAGGHGHAAYMQGKGDNEASKHAAAWSSKVGDDACRIYMGRLPELAATDHMEHAADYHLYPTTTTTALARY